MHEREWTFADKADWPRGEWDDEPDKVQWIDDATGLHCLAYRGTFGAWCGYVGVGDNHPAYGLHYDGCTQAEADERSEAFRRDTKKWALAGFPPLSEWFEQSDFYKNPTEKAIVMPLQDKCSVHGGLTYSSEARDPIYYADGPEKLWFFGFDCAHAGDYAPKHSFEKMGAPTGWGGVVEYRTLAYVRQEITNLAQQLAAICEEQK